MSKITCLKTSDNPSNEKYSLFCIEFQRSCTLANQDIIILSDENNNIAE
jgi:hypothetical protein